MNQEKFNNDMKSSIDLLQKEIEELKLIIKFHKLEIPLKYKKAWTTNGRTELFAHEPFDPTEPRIEGEMCFHKHTFGTFKSPKTPEKLREARKRMLEYATYKDRIFEEYFSLWEELNVIGEVMTFEEANAWVEEEGEVIYWLCNKEGVKNRNASKKEAEDWDKLEEENYSYPVPKRHFMKLGRMVYPKPKLSEEPSIPSSQQDSSQQ